MRSVSLIFIGLLSACNTPPAAFRDSPVSRVEVEQSQFDIRVGDGKALAIRTNAEGGAQLGGINQRATLAINQSTGCSIVPGTFESDEVFFRADLAC